MKEEPLIIIMSKLFKIVIVFLNFLSFLQIIPHFSF